MPNPATPKHARAILDDQPTADATITLGIECRCPLEYATRQHGRRSITWRIHTDDCALGRHIAEQDGCS